MTLGSLVVILPRFWVWSGLGRLDLTARSPPPSPLPPHHPHPHLLVCNKAAWLFHYYLGSGRRGDRVRKIMAGGVVAGQHAHMELVLKAENEAREAQELAAAAAGAGAGEPGGSQVRLLIVLERVSAYAP